MSVSTCCICSGLFEQATEGGVDGVIGTFITFSICPDCYTGICDMVDQKENRVNLECPDCGHEFKVKIEIDHD
jgi:hypothetical protein